MKIQNKAVSEYLGRMNCMGYFTVPFECKQNGIKGRLLMSQAEREKVFFVDEDQWRDDGCKGVIVYDSTPATGLSEMECLHLEKLKPKAVNIQFVDFSKVNGSVVRNGSYGNFEFYRGNERVTELPRLVRCYLTVRKEYAGNFAALRRLEELFGG